MRHRRGRATALRATLCASAVIALVAGCGSDDEPESSGAPVSTSAESTASSTGIETESTGSGAQTTDEAQSDSPLGTPNAATGEPIRIGYATTGKNETIDYTHEEDATKAVVSYINDYLGGIGGRPIELLTCEDGRAEARIATCINEMLSADVPLVVTPSTANATLYANSFTEAGVPWVLNQAADPVTLTSDGVYVLTYSPAATLTAPARVAAAEGFERVAYLVIDSPGLVAALQDRAAQVYGAVGVEVDLIGIPPGTADMTPQVAAAMQKDPDAVMVVGNPAFCISALTALETNGFAGATMTIPQCIDNTVNDAVPGGLEGIRMFGFATTDPKDPDIVLRDAIYAEYEPDIVIDALTDGAFQTFMGVHRVLGSMTGEVTPETVKAAFADMAEMPLPLGGGITFKCDGAQVPGLIAICGSAGLQSVFDAEGVSSDFSVLDLAANS